MRNFTTRETFPHEQRSKGSTRGRRLVDATDPGKCGVWRRILLRDRPDFPQAGQQKTARSCGRQTRLVLRRLLVFYRREWPVHNRRFHSPERRAHYGRGEDRDRIALPDFVECRHSRFRFSSARTCATFDRRASSRAIFQGSSVATKVEDSASENRRQCLDRDERYHFERGEYRRELSCCRRIGGQQERTLKHSGCG